MKLLFKMLVGVGLVLLFNGCASTSGPTSRVGIVNGRYAVQTTVPNNNKGKKVNLTGGQSYSCETSFVDKSGKQIKYTFDLKITPDAKYITWYNDKDNGVAPKTAYIRKMVFKPSLGAFVETTKHDQVLVPSRNNTGNILLLKSEKEAKKFFRLNQKYQNGKLTKSEYQNQIRKIRAYQAVCTQTTNNTYYNTRYMSRDEIDMYKTNQQLAVQQRAIDSANYNASMDRLQAQTAQMNYNTQQMLNRMNTYNVRIY